MNFIYYIFIPYAYLIVGISYFVNYIDYEIIERRSINEFK